MAKPTITTLEGAKLLVSTYYSLQKERVQTQLRIGQLERDGVSTKRELQYLHDFMDSKLLSAEKEIKAEMNRFNKQVPIYNEFLANVKGIGPIIAAGLISTIGTESPNYGVGIARFATISKLWAYAGQHTIKVDDKGNKWFPSEADARAFHRKHVEWYAEKATKKIDVEKEIEKRLKHACWGDMETFTERAKRKAGHTANWNPFLKTLSWKIGESFTKAGGFYRGVYDEARAHYDKNTPDDSKGHNFAKAKRKAVKRFLSDLWINWRELEGLPVRDPYVIDKMNHTTMKNFKGEGHN